MKKTWLCSFFILVFQIVVFFAALAFPIAEQGKYTVALGIVSAVTFVILLNAVVSVPRILGRIDAVFALVVAGAFAGALALTFAMAEHDIISAVAAFVGLYAVAFMMAYLATFPAMNDDPDKPRWALLVAALSLGIGAVGGGILLRVFRKNTAGTSNAPHSPPQYIGRKFSPSVPAGEDTSPSE